MTPPAVPRLFGLAPDGAIVLLFVCTAHRKFPMRLQCLIVLTAALSFAGCDPGIVVEGTVTDAAKKPISGAQVQVTCQGFNGKSSSDDDGKFTLDLGLGCLPNDCRVNVSVEDKSKDFKVGEHCETAVDQCDDGCNVVQIDARF